MNDNPESNDQTDRVGAPMIRVSATLQASNVHTLNGNGALDTNLDQTEPCSLAPMVRLSAKDGPEENS
jgi:hypothetical protein